MRLVGTMIIRKIKIPSNIFIFLVFDAVVHWRKIVCETSALHAYEFYVS